MKKKLFIPLKLQFFAEPVEPGAGTEPGSEGNASQGNIDYGKIQSMLDTATQKKENAVLKSYFQQQGLSEEEAKQAMEDFKNSKQQQQQQQQTNNTMLQDQVTQATAAAEQAQVELEATKTAVSLGIDMKSLPYILKMADLSNVKDKDGKISTDSVKEAINKVLEDVPALKPSNQGNGGFKIGADNNQGQQQTTDDALKAAFGL
ncbi:MAG: hypothetical protein Q4F05_11270 [bacterium]|nr:hypothetical protein [bacterium]